MSVLRRTGLVLGGGALIVALGAVAIRYLAWPNTVVIAAASVSSIVLLVAAVVAVAAGTAARSWVVGVPAVAVLIAAVAIQAPLFFADDDPAEHGLTVLTSNIQLGQGDVDQLAQLVRDQRVDVLAVQELTSDAADRIARSTIIEDLPHAFVRPAKLAYGTAIYSRYPLVNARSLDGFGLQNLTATVAVPDRGEVRVFAVHPVPPTHAADWAEEVDRLGRAFGAVPERPVIALGDFNATVDNARFRRLLTGGYRDAGEVAGAGWLPTYPTDKSYPPVVGIDHVLIRDLTASDVTTYSIDGADHRAVLAKVG